MEKSRLVIAIDAMGGDYAPDCVIAGVKAVETKMQDVHFLLFGDEEKVRPFIDKYRLDEARYEFVHTPDYVSSEEKPSAAVRSGRKSSMWLAIDSVKKSKASAVVSSGNTGALMAFSKLILGTMANIHRPAIISIIPTNKSECVVLDLGANAECNARNLVEFAVMGDAYCRAVLKKETPTIGLLNIGSEESKGRDEIREAAQILKNSPLSASFHGFVESDDIALGVVDVFVTDGFSGNIALKAIEGTARLVVTLLKDYAKNSLISKLGFLLAMPTLRRLKSKMNPDRYNGAMLIGLKGVSIKSHGGADALGFENAIKFSVEAVRNDMVQNISKQLDLIEFLEEEKQ